MSEAMKGKGLRRSRHEWRSLLAKFDVISLGGEAFCQREAINAASLYRWRNLLDNGGERVESVASVTAPAFGDLGTLGAAAAMS